jgi:hypothetical protein
LVCYLNKYFLFIVFDVQILASGTVGSCYLLCCFLTSAVLVVLTSILLDKA